MAITAIDWTAKAPKCHMYVTVASCWGHCHYRSLEEYKKMKYDCFPQGCSNLIYSTVHTFDKICKQKTIQPCLIL